MEARLLFTFQVENLVLECPFPKSVLNVTLTPNQGKYTFDPVTKVMTWDIGRLEATRAPNIKGTVSFVCFLVKYTCFFNSSFV